MKQRKKKIKLKRDINLIFITRKKKFGPKNKLESKNCFFAK